MRRTGFVPWSICGSHSFVFRCQKLTNVLFSMFFLQCFLPRIYCVYMCVLYSCVLAGYFSHHCLNRLFKSFRTIVFLLEVMPSLLYLRLRDRTIPGSTYRRNGFGWFFCNLQQKLPMRYPQNMWGTLSAIELIPLLQSEFVPYCWWKSCTSWDVSNLVNTGVNYQPQLLSRISSINSMTQILHTRWVATALPQVLECSVASMLWRRDSTWRNSSNSLDP